MRLTTEERQQLEALRSRAEAVDPVVALHGLDGRLREDPELVLDSLADRVHDARAAMITVARKLIGALGRCRKLVTPLRRAIEAVEACANQLLEVELDASPAHLEDSQR